MRTRLFVLSVAAVLTAASTAATKDIFVSALRGSDTSGTGTVAAPYKTISFAITKVSPNDTIRVLPGRYSPAHGETFPISLPQTVNLIGDDMRTCIIDAEFDPNVPNPKDPKVNPVQGHMLLVATDCRVANLGLINGPRNPANASDYWWAICVLLGDAIGNSKNVEVDHLWLDEVSRGIVAGYAAGDHNMSNIQIHDVIVTRSYVEAINSWINKGQASNNVIFNCTLAGHVNPAANKPFMRAAISFGAGAVFDVRNCVIMLADWAGIENGGATVTSNNNCIDPATVRQAYVNVTAGTSDLSTDPKIMTPPTTTALMDPHQLGLSGPLYQAGVLMTGQQNHQDMDYRSPRVFAGRVDIGADEWTTNDAWFHGWPIVGQSFRLSALGPASQPVVFVLGFGSLATGIPIPGFSGRLFVDPTKPLLLVPAAADPRGFASVVVPLPQIAALAGNPLALQGLHISTSTPGLTDLDEVVIID